MGLTCFIFRFLRRPQVASSKSNEQQMEVNMAYVICPMVP